MLVEAERPVIYAGQGVHYAQAWPQLRALAELLEAPVTTSLQGKSAFPENHPLALGSGGRADPEAGASLPGPRRRHLRHWLQLCRDHLRRGDARRARRSSTPRSTRPTSTTRCRSTTRSPGTPRSPSMPCSARSRSGSVAPPGDASPPWPAEIAVGESGVACALAAEIDLRRGPALPLPRDPGPAAHRRRRQHHHHPRRGLPARSALALLGSRGAAVLPRLGQDDATRLWPRAGHGRQAGQARQALYQCLGRCRDRLHRHGFRNRRPRAAADPVDLAQ